MCACVRVLADCFTPFSALPFPPLLPLHRPPPPPPGPISAGLRYPVQSLLGYFPLSILLLCPDHIICRFCASFVMSFSISIISLIVSFRIYLPLSFCTSFRRQSISVANGLLPFCLLTSHACAPYIETLSAGLIVHTFLCCLAQILSRNMEYRDLIMFLPLLAVRFISPLQLPFALSGSAKCLHLSGPLT
jgi:hypothetical protein